MAADLQERQNLLKLDTASCQTTVKGSTGRRDVLLQAGISSCWWRVTCWLPFFITTWCLIRPNLSHHGSTRVPPVIRDFGGRTLYQPVLHYCRADESFCLSNPILGCSDLETTNKADKNEKQHLSVLCLLLVCKPSPSLVTVACLDEYLRT